MSHGSWAPGGWQQPAPVRWGPPPPQQPPPVRWGAPPPQRPRRGGLGKALFVLIAVAIVLVVAVNVFRVVRDFAGTLAPESLPTPVPTTAEPFSQQPSPPPVASPTAEASAPPTEPPAPTPGLRNPGLPKRSWPALPRPNSDDPDWVSLQQSELYAQAVPAVEGCPEPALARDMAELEAQATEQMRCVQAAFKPLQAALGYSTADIPIYFYEGRSVDTPCGTVEAPALYCSTQGGAIYFGEDALNGTSWMDFGVKDITGHEYGHHLQAQAGMFQAEQRVGNGYESARRIELQATCWSYAMLSHDPTVPMGRRQVAEFEEYLRATIEDGIHGSRDSIAYWGLRGLYSDDMGNCNTWTARPKDVD